MKRFSVLYQLKEQYKHIGASSQEEAKKILQKLGTDKRRIPVGIYDSKTELINWAPAFKVIYDHASISEQGRRTEAIVRVAQALWRRDSSWNPAAGFSPPTLFA
ncbi:hypothetical protein [Spirosoma panaciterrae]|uniref:hypothetical protein n=1 Tax=Spirosoma panaciterrae TaxID=496058 RepID=UPI00035DEBE9|nr:hypothetical protein [Spirosoma panaciterrae]